MNPTTYTWSCPQCGRRVPTRQDICHCGFEQRRAMLSGYAPATTRGLPSPRAHGGWVLTTALMVGCLVSAFAAVRWQTPLQEQTAQAATGETPPSHYAPLPAVVVQDEPTEVAEAIEPLGIEYTAIAAEPPSPPEPPPAPRPSPEAERLEPRTAPPATPTPSSMEEAWQKAKALLQARLATIAGETDRLESGYQAYLEACFSQAAASPGRRHESNWLVALKATADKGPNQDCQASWTTLMTRANELKAELDQTENLARTSGVLPGLWRQLLTAQRLEVWAEF